MPTPVSTARQCLTPEAAHALDEAVSVARRRGHGQTTSLHAVSALLSLPSSILRDACARARNPACSSRVQFKALDLCLSVSLDRVPSSQLTDDPPVSNSLMAAIKRSQANQRRQPENFHLYHQIAQQQSSSSSSSSTSMSCIKVELQNLILSILDDPVVNRVFGEAGFRSSEIKLAIVRPLPQVFNCSRFKGPPLFLCNLSDNPDSFSSPSRWGFSFPFPGHAGISSGDENCRRIGEVLVRNKGRNPLLVGVSACDTLGSFSEMVERRKDNILPVELSGLSVICIASDISKFINGNCDKGNLDLRFEEVGRVVDRCLGPGLLVNFGDLKAFVSNDNGNCSSSGNDSSEAVVFVVEKLTKLLQIHGEKVWLIGAVSSDEIYLKFTNKFPSISKDWDLHLLPLTSLRTSMAESYPRSSLMESFVPFGGFFSSPSDLHSPISSSSQSMPRCNQCNEKCEQELLSVLKGGFTASVADQHQSSLPSWMQMSELGTSKGSNMKTRDDGVLLSTKVAGLRKKWDSICQRHHHTQSAGSSSHPSWFPSISGFQPVGDKKEDAENHGSFNMKAPAGNKGVNVSSCINMDLQNIPRVQLAVPFPAISEANTESNPSKQWGKPSREKDHESGAVRSPASFSNSSIGDGSRASPGSVTSVTTDLGLRISSVPLPESKKPASQSHLGHLQDLSGSFSGNIDIVNRNISGNLAQSPASSSPDCGDIINFKKLFRDLSAKVGWQVEAIDHISRTIAHQKTSTGSRHVGNLRGGTWLNFSGPDRSSKKKVAAALAEIISGSRENLVFADLSLQDGMSNNNTFFDQSFRGKTMVDYVARELSKKPWSVVFLENIDKADFQMQHSLSQAIRTGKFSDSYGREVGINYTTFVTTIFGEDKILSSKKGLCTYSEERILRAKGRPMQILIEQALGKEMGQNLTSFSKRKSVSGSVFVNKRKLVDTNEDLEQHESSELVKRAHTTSPRNLDLNLPAGENDMQGNEDGTSDNDNLSENSKIWLEDFLDQVDNVVFKSFDFDALAGRLLHLISESFHKIVGLEYLLEIDSEVVEQLLAAEYLSDKNRVVENWVEQVLSCAFKEVIKKYNLNSHSVLKLIACEGPFLEDNLQGVCLPQKIVIK